MNIHFDSATQYAALKLETIFAVEFGSCLYGLKNEHSDSDVMNIYSWDDQELFRNHHQFQYKIDNTDQIFVSYEKFIANLISGDSTINFEIVYSGLLEESILNEYRNEFITYQTIRSYLGMGRRDLDQYHKKEGRDQNKKVIHGIRSYLFAQRLMDVVLKGNEFDMNCSHLSAVYSSDKDELLLDAKSYKELIEIARQRLNDNIGKIPRYPSVECQRAVLDDFSRLKTSYKGVKLESVLMDASFTANIKDITY